MVCDDSSGACPRIPWAGSIIHQTFSDPGSWTGTDGTCLEQFRALWDERIALIDATFG